MGLFSRIQKMTNNRPISLAGLDISTTAVKLIELQSHEGNYEVVSYGIEFLPDSAIEGRELKDVEVVGNAIRRLMVKSHTSAKQAAIAVAGTTVITKVIQLDADLSDDEMEAQIAVEADQHIPYSLEEILFDFGVVGLNSQDESKIDVMLAASHADVVEARLDALEIAKVSASVVDVERFAMERAVSLILEQLDQEQAENVIAIVDIGSCSTTLSIIQHKDTIYTREQEFGGRMLIELIEQQYSVSFDEALEMKKQDELPEDYNAMVLDPFKASMAEQIYRSLQFFYASSQFNTVDRVILAGGAATISGFAETIEKRINTPVHVANPFANMSVGKRVNVNALNKDAPALMLSCGLALRAFENGVN